MRLDTSNERYTKKTESSLSKGARLAPPVKKRSGTPQVSPHMIIAQPEQQACVRL